MFVMNLKRSILTVFLLALLTVPASAAAATDATKADAPKVTIIYFWGDG